MLEASALRRLGPAATPRRTAAHKRARANLAYEAATTTRAAFAAVSRQGRVPLTYFEMGTLARCLRFAESRRGCVLEVGWGRLARDVSTRSGGVTHRGYEHVDFLSGPARRSARKEAIPRRPAGLMRHPAPRPSRRHARRSGRAVGSGADFGVTARTGLQLWATRQAQCPPHRVRGVPHRQCGAVIYALE